MRNFAGAVLLVALLGMACSAQAYEVPPVLVESAEEKVAPQQRGRFETIFDAITEIDDVIAPAHTEFVTTILNDSGVAIEVSVRTGCNLSLEKAASQRFVVQESLEIPLMCDYQEAGEYLPYAIVASTSEQQESGLSMMRVVRVSVYPAR